MKPEAERAIRTLDELIAWLAQKGIIKNQPALDRLASALKVVADNCEHDDGEKEAMINALAETIIKMRLVLRCCGFNEKGINYFTNDFTEEELEWFLKFYLKYDTALPLNHPLGEDLLRTQTRITRYKETNGPEIDQNYN